MMPHDHHQHHFDDRHAGIINNNYQQMMGVNDVLLTESMMSDLSISPDNSGEGNGGGGGVIATSNGGDIDAQLLPEDARPVTPSPANVQGLPMKELENALRRQLEYYFSSENLAKDTYLRSQMDKEQYVLIEIVANFQLIKNLTNDFDLIVNVLRHSSEVHVDDEGLRVRPLSKRCVVILRDAPEEVKEENIKKMFEMEKCPVTLIKCEFVSAGFWYLFFASDEDAQTAFRYLKETLVTYPGTNSQIMARIKAKPIVSQRNKSLKAPNVIRPIGIVTAPSPGGSTVSNQSAAVSPVSSISGSVNNATVLIPNHVTPPYPAIISDTVGVAPYSSANTIYSPYPPNVPILPNSRIPQVFSSTYYPHSPAMIPLPNTSSGHCYDLSSIFVTNGLAPHTYPSGVVTSLTAGSVPQTCLSVAPSGPSAHHQQPPQLQFIATSGAGGPALIAANPRPHVSNPGGGGGGGRYGSNTNYGNSYYTTHYTTYPKSHGGGSRGGGGDGGHHRGSGSSNSGSGGQSGGKSYRNGGKYNNNSNSGYMSGSYHHTDYSSQSFKQSSKGGGAPTAAVSASASATTSAPLPSLPPPTVATLVVGGGSSTKTPTPVPSKPTAILSAPTAASKVAATAANPNKSSATSSGSSKEPTIDCTAASVVIANHNSKTEGGPTAAPVQLSKVMAAEALSVAAAVANSASTKNSNSTSAAVVAGSATATHNSTTNELPKSAAPVSSAASNNNNTSVVAGGGDLVNHHHHHHDSSASTGSTSNYDNHHHNNSHHQQHNNSNHLPHKQQPEHRPSHHNSHYHKQHQQQHQSANHIGGFGGSQTDSATTRHHTNSVSFVSLSESDFPLDGLSTAPVIETSGGGQQSAGSSSSFTYAQVAQRPKVGKLPVPQGI